MAERDRPEIVLTDLAADYPSVAWEALTASGIAIREYLAWAFDYRSVAVKP